jgi:hypothetical protein
MSKRNQTVIAVLIIVFVLGAGVFSFMIGSGRANLFASSKPKNITIKPTFSYPGKTETVGFVLSGYNELKDTSSVKASSDKIKVGKITNLKSTNNASILEQSGNVTVTADSDINTGQYKLIFTIKKSVSTMQKLNPLNKNIELTEEVSTNFEIKKQPEVITATPASAKPGDKDLTIVITGTDVIFVTKPVPGGLTTQAQFIDTKSNKPVPGLAISKFEVQEGTSSNKAGKGKATAEVTISTQALPATYSLLVYNSQVVSGDSKIVNTYKIDFKIESTNKIPHINSAVIQPDNKQAKKGEYKTIVITGYNFNKDSLKDNTIRIVKSDKRPKEWSGWPKYEITSSDLSSMPQMLTTNKFPADAATGRYALRIFSKYPDYSYWLGSNWYPLDIVK